MFEIIATICDLTIAVVGLLFTIRQVHCDIKAKAKEKMEEKCCFELAQKSIEISKLINNIENSTEVMKMAAENIAIPSMQKNEEKLLKPSDQFFKAIQVAHHDCEEIYHKCIEVKADIDSIYTNLLRNESMFSLSIGFGRIIDACRPVVYGMDEQLNNLNNKFIKLHETTYKIGFHQCGNMTDEDVVTLQKNFEEMIYALIAISKLLEGIYPMVKELELKFSIEE